MPLVTRSILKDPKTHKQHTKKLVWDEQALAAYQNEKPVRMRIDEPKTPFVTSISPEEMRLCELQDSTPNTTFAHSYDAFVLDGDRSDACFEGSDSPNEAFSSTNSSAAWTSTEEEGVGECIEDDTENVVHHHVVEAVAQLKRQFKEKRRSHYQNMSEAFSIGRELIGSDGE